MPTTHDSSVTKEKVLLLACLMEGRSIDIGQLIHREIAQCTTKRMCHLFFLNLISKLCMKSNALVVQDEEVLTEKRLIDKPLLDMLMCYELSRRSVIPIGAINEMMAHQTKISAELKSSVATLAQQITARDEEFKVP